MRRAQFPKRHLLPRALPVLALAVSELELDLVILPVSARDEILALGVARRRLEGCKLHLVDEELAHACDRCRQLEVDLGTRFPTEGAKEPRQGSREGVGIDGGVLGCWGGACCV